VRRLDLGPVWVSCYCAFCKSPRRVYTKKHVRVTDVLYAFALGILMSLFFWQELNFRLIPFSITVLGLMEIVVQLRWRMSLPCQKCGFDPLIYLKSPEKAAERVRFKFEKRLENPSILDKRLPLMLSSDKSYKLTPTNINRQVPENKI
jgi:hypothetical protein